MTFKSEIVFVRMLLPFMAGVFCSYNYGAKIFIIPTLIVILLLFLYLIAVNLLYKKIKAYNFKGITGLFFYFFCFALGGLLCLMNNQTLKDDYFANQNYEYLKVWVSNEPAQTNDILRFEVEVTDAVKNNKIQKTTGKLLIALKVDSLNPLGLNYGDELLITAKYLPVEPPYNPGEFDFKSWLASKNIYQQTFINQNQIVKTHKIKGSAVKKYAIEERKKQVAIYRRLIINDEAFAVASTLVLGYRANLSKETLAAYSKTGTIHALSVSGAHVGIIFILLTVMLSFLDRNKFLKVLKVVIICFLIWYYALLTGFSSSVLRSAIMISVFILTKAFNKKSNNYNILAFTAFCLLFYNPFFIMDVGFQLSFISVFGLIYLQPKIYKWLYFKNKWIDKLWAAVALSLAAQLATFPLSIYYFHQFPVYFLLGNIFILLPLMGIMYLGIAILVIRVNFVAPFFEWMITFTNNGLKWISELPFSGVTSIWLAQWQLILLTFALLLLIYSLVNYRKKLLVSAVCLLIIFQSYTSYSKILAMRQRKMISFSLRKNYATAFIDRDHAILVTDLNPNENNYKFFVQPGLDKMQVKNVSFINWEQDTLVSSFQKYKHQIRFHNYQILLLDSTFNYKKIENQPHYNSIWIHKSPRIKIENLKDRVKFSTLLIDASNKDYKIEQYKTEANKFGLDHHVFKKNNSYLIDLNLKSQP